MSSQPLTPTLPERESDLLEMVSTCGVCDSRDIEAIDAECNLCRCVCCGFIFDSPRPTEQAIANFYSQDEKYDSWLEDLKARDALWRRRLKKLLPHRLPGNLLDIGTGIGQFLHQARPYFSAVEGTEVSESAIRIARQRYGLEIHRGQVERLELQVGAHDNITLFHVLEHVPFPAVLIRKCHELLRPGGVLLIAVPNDVMAWGSWVKRTGRRLGLRPFRKFSRVLGIARAGTSREIHLSHFTPAVLRKLVIDQSFTVIQEGLDPYYAVSGLWSVAHSLYYAVHCTLLSVFAMNRYETIWLVAQKQLQPRSGEEPLRRVP
jgi:2-polyprenyl-3-methyl-5-hydroxy-6-metoxy-1,4-benzoquinol methylase